MAVRRWHLALCVAATVFVQIGPAPADITGLFQHPPAACLQSQGCGHTDAWWDTAPAGRPRGRARDAAAPSARVGVRAAVDQSAAAGAPPTACGLAAGPPSGRITVS